jgi:putative membrane protein
MNSIGQRSLTLLSASLLLAASSVVAFAQNAASDDDKHFVESALKGGMAEIDLGKLAADKGASADVKAFGQKMVTDHGRLGEKMKTVAGEIGVKPPDMSTVSDMGEKAKLEILSGKTFDDAYISAMLRDHENDLEAFKQEVASGTSPAVKRAARQGEAVVEAHLAMIRKIAKAHDVTDDGQGSAPGHN